MSFKILKSEGKEIVVNTDRIISVVPQENGKTLINCTDQFNIVADMSAEEVKKILGVKTTGESRVGFKPS